MPKNFVIVISQAGERIATAVARHTGGTIIPRADVGSAWADADAFVFVGAMGVCVRTIAPHITDKHTDPAVVCIDTEGRHVVAVLSGHVGGANDLAADIAAVIGGTAVITTQSDVAGLWPLDTLNRRFGWQIADADDMNACIFAFVGRKPTALLMEVRDEGTDYLESTLPDHVTVVGDISEVTAGRFELAIIVSPYCRQVPKGVLCLHFVPTVATVGFGLAHHPDNYGHIYDDMRHAFAERGLMMCADTFCTIDVKADEPFVDELRRHGHAVRFFTADELSRVTVPTPSAVVERHVGTPSVSEAAAILGSNNGALLVSKVKGATWTAALAIDRRFMRRQHEGHVEIVGAGPGDPDLISVRGRQWLERADLILYAGSLVPEALTRCHKPGATVVSSAGMDLEAQCRLMLEYYQAGKTIVRLHTGDPCIFGAIEEQMAFFDTHAMSYHITPGISSFLAAAAELRSQFTIAERTQTIILTRGEGRTPMPEREQLRHLARSQSTMCIFLSAAIVDDVQAQLLEGGYPPETPVAACYHLTWPDQHIYRGQLKDLADIVRSNGLTLTTMIVVGWAIDNRQGASRLYDTHFTHLFRTGKTD